MQGPLNFKPPYLLLPLQNPTFCIRERYKLRRCWLSGQCHVRTFEGHAGGVSCVQFDSSRIVSGSHDKTIRVWNIKTNRYKCNKNAMKILCLLIGQVFEHSLEHAYYKVVMSLK